MSASITCLNCGRSSRLVRSLAICSSPRFRWCGQIRKQSFGLRLPQFANRLSQEPQHAASLLEVGDRRSLAIERRQQFGVERIVLDHLGLVFGPNRPLRQVHSLLDHAGAVGRPGLGRFQGGLAIDAGEQPVVTMALISFFGGRRQDVLLAGRDAAGLGQFLPQFVGLLAEGVG